MRLFSTVISTLALVAILAPAPASAQYADSSSFFDLHPELTKEEFEQFTAELGSILRFRQLGDTATLGRGNVEVGVQFANNTPINDSKGAFNNLGRSISVPRIIARFGVTDRVDVGAWGGLNPNSNYGLVGVDTKIALLTQGPARPVSVSIRPSITSLVGPSEVWVGNASIDVSVSRALGSLSPYASVATSGSLAIERSKDVDLDPATADGSLAYAGLSYRWRALFVAGEVEKGALITYGFRIGTRF